MNPTYIVAGNYEQFKQYVRDKNEYWTKQAMLMPEYKYVTNVDTLRGLTSVKGYYIGTWANRPDIAEIQQQIAIIKTKSKSNYMVYFNGVLLSEQDYILTDLGNNQLKIQLGIIGQGMLDIRHVSGKGYNMPVISSIKDSVWMVQL